MACAVGRRPTTQCNACTGASTGGMWMECECDSTSLLERVGQTPENGGSKPTVKLVGWWFFFVTHTTRLFASRARGRMRTLVLHVACGPNELIVLHFSLTQIAKNGGTVVGFSRMSPKPTRSRRLHVDSTSTSQAVNSCSSTSSISQRPNTPTHACPHRRRAEHLRHRSVAYSTTCHVRTCTYT